MPEADPLSRLARLKRRAALALVWEALWPPLAFAGAVGLVFAAASWFGLWFEAPPYARLTALVLFGLAFLAALFPLLRLRWPGARPTLHRLDRDADTRHAPASALEDRLANASDDPATQALWALHRERAAREIAALRVKPPAPRVALRDPYALRFVAVLLAAVGFMAAGPERFARLAAAFHGIPSLVPATIPARVDAWIDPPGYANKPPIFLKIGEGDPARSVTAPEGSVLVVRADPQAVAVTVSGGLVGAPSPAPQERRFVLHGDGEAKIDQGASRLTDLTLKAVPLTKPIIRLLDPPQGNASGSLTLHYAIEDAYGVAEVGGEAALTAPAAHLLYGPPLMALAPSAGANGTGEAKAVVDLSEHPWAGAKATLTLTARSTSGVQAKSPPVEITLPQRRFVNPLAKALVEQRRNLALDPDRNAARVARALAALRLGPDLFETSPRVYLDLNMLHDQLGVAKTDDDLREVVGELWTLALSIETGDASRALKDLRSAEQNLRDALKRNAGPEELKKLTQELKDAANRYLSEMARKADKNADKNAQEDSDQMESKDLNAMLDRLERDTKEGAKEDAEAALDELQDTMENMQSAQNQKPDPARKQTKKSMRDLENLLKDQQALRNDTFREDQRERAGEAPPKDEKTPDRKLEDRQRAVKDKLDDIEKQLRAAGVDTPKNLDDAAGDMAQAQEDLKGEGQKGKSKRRYGRTAKGEAVDEQGKAIEALRQGGQSLAQQMRGKGQGKESYVGKPGGRQGENSDPLGRGRNGKKGAAEGELSGGADHAERARRVLEELRKRLSDPNRTAQERDYLERLIGQP